MVINNHLLTGMILQVDIQSYLLRRCHLGPTKHISNTRNTSGWYDWITVRCLPDQSIASIDISRSGTVTMKFAICLFFCFRLWDSSTGVGTGHFNNIFLQSEHLACSDVLRILPWTIGMHQKRKSKKNIISQMLQWDWNIYHAFTNVFKPNVGKYSIKRPHTTWGPKR